ncbi:hypothetical protein PHMEG_00022161, partial [Phytophthora megakarya]
MAKQKKIASQGSSIFSQETSPSSSPASTSWDDGDELLLGAPIRKNQAGEEVKEDEIEARVDRILVEWLKFDPEWLDVAKHQNPNKSEEELENSLSIGSTKGTFWSLLGLYKYVDVLQWFRDECESRF